MGCVPFEIHLPIPMQIEVPPSRKPLGQVVLLREVRSGAFAHHVVNHTRHLFLTLPPRRTWIQPHYPSVRTPRPILAQPVGNFFTMGRQFPVVTRVVVLGGRRWHREKSAEVDSFPWKQVQVQQQHPLVWKFERSQLREHQSMALAARLISVRRNDWFDGHKPVPTASSQTIANTRTFAQAAGAEDKHSVRIRRRIPQAVAEHARIYQVLWLLAMEKRSKAFVRARRLRRELLSAPTGRAFAREAPQTLCFAVTPSLLFRRLRNGTMWIHPLLARMTHPRRIAPRGCVTTPHRVKLVVYVGLRAKCVHRCTFATDLQLRKNTNIRIRRGISPHLLTAHAYHAVVHPWNGTGRAEAADKIEAFNS
mmetsp:Transcript_88189/g.248150  ORF Transcript_88189/g.248150 Transcript_88189/m.248150 type:complete len:364 (+) Transcript_88189:670-1761(+)